MNGPWYTIGDASAKLGITQSELSHLITTDDIQAVAYTKPRSFLLFRLGPNGWTGHASCTYRGPMTLHKTLILQLLDGDSVVIGKNYGILLEDSGASNWQSAYPFKKPPPHPPLFRWGAIELGAVNLSSLAATPMPYEGEQVVATLARFIDKTINPPGSPPSSDPKLLALTQQLSGAYSEDGPDLQLSFSQKELFEPSCLRVAQSEVSRYQGATTAKAIAVNDDPDTTQHQSGRENQLHTLIDRIIDQNPKISAKAAWRLLEADVAADEPTFDTDSILQIADSHCVHWVSRNGTEQVLKWKSFGPALSKLKKRREPQSEQK